MRARPLRIPLGQSADLAYTINRHDEIATATTQLPPSRDVLHHLALNIRSRPKLGLEKLLTHRTQIDLEPSLESAYGATQPELRDVTDNL